MSKTIKKVTKAVITCAFLMTLILLSSGSAQAKIKMYYKNLYLGRFETRQQSFDNLPEGAVVKYKSNNKKIATVSKTGLIKAHQLGTTTIDVNYTLNGETKEIGTVNIYVKTARVEKETKEEFKNKTIQLTGNNGYFTKNPILIKNYFKKNDDTYYLDDPLDSIKYENKKAVYKYVSSDKSKLKITKKGKLYYSSGNGKVTLSIVEIYKNKKRTLFSYKVNLAKPSWKWNKKINASKKQVYDIITHTPYVEKQKVVFKDSSNKEISNSEKNKSDDIEFLKNSKNSWNGRIRFNKTGKKYCYLYDYNYKTKKFNSKPYAIIDFNVKNVTKLSKIKLLDYENAVGQDLPSFKKIPGITSDTVNPGAGGEDDPGGFDSIHPIEYQVYQDAYNYTGGYTISSSDPSVATVSSLINDQYENFFDETNGHCGYFIVYPHKSGSCKIKISGNGAETTLDFKYIYSNWEYDEEIRFTLSMQDVVSEKPDASKFKYEIEDNNPLNLTNCRLQTYIEQNDKRTNEKNADPHLWYYNVYFIVSGRPPAKSGSTTLAIYYGENKLTYAEIELKIPEYTKTEYPTPKTIYNSGVDFSIQNSYKYEFINEKDKKEHGSSTSFEVLFDKEITGAKYVFAKPYYDYYDISVDDIVNNFKKTKGYYEGFGVWYEELWCFGESPLVMPFVWRKEMSCILIFTDEDRNYIGHAVLENESLPDDE